MGPSPWRKGGQGAEVGDGGLQGVEPPHLGPDLPVPVGKHEGGEEGVGEAEEEQDEGEVGREGREGGRDGGD